MSGQGARNWDLNKGSEEEEYEECRTYKGRKKQRKLLCMCNIHDYTDEIFVLEKQTSLGWLEFKNEKDSVGKDKGQGHLRTDHEGLEWN